MPVWKYRSVAQMPPTPAYTPGSREHLERWAALWARASALGRKRFRSGVFRYRSVEESWREAGAMERFDEQRDGRGDRGPS